MTDDVGERQETNAAASEMPLPPDGGGKRRPRRDFFGALFLLLIEGAVRIDAARELLGGVDVSGHLLNLLDEGDRAVGDEHRRGCADCAAGDDADQKAGKAGSKIGTGHCG